MYELGVAEMLEQIFHQSPSLGGVPGSKLHSHRVQSALDHNAGYVAIISNICGPT